MFSQLIQAVLLTWHSTYEDKALSLLRYFVSAKTQTVTDCYNRLCSVSGAARSSEIAMRRGQGTFHRCSVMPSSSQCRSEYTRVSSCLDLGAIQIRASIRATGTSYVLFRSIVSFYHSAQQCYSVLSAGFLQTVFEQFNMFPYFGCIVNQM